MPRITISYRRDDSLDITGRIFDRLAGHFGREAVFRDVDSIPLGTDFRRHIDRVLDQSDIILAIVGPRWIGPDNEHVRLASPADPVRLEIETALRKDKPLIPVLVSRAVMPQPHVLPDSLHDFVYHNAVQVDSGQDFDVHVGRLIRAIEQLVRIGEEHKADEIVQGAPPIKPTPKAEPPVDRVESPVDRQVVRANEGHPVRWVLVLGLVVILVIISASGWWVLVEQPRREAPAVEKARAEDRASQAAATAKAQQEEQARQAAAAKAQQEEQARQAAAAKAQQEEQARQAAAAKAQQEEQARQAAVNYKEPVYRGYHLDWCQLFQNNCGKPAADAFCSYNGQGPATRWAIRSNPGFQTMTIGQNAICNPSSHICDSFSFIECQRLTFSNPAYRGYRLDWCRIFEDECGAPAAKAFCRLNGFSGSSAFQFEHNPGVRTMTIGQNSICEPSSHVCDTFSSITCIQ